MAGPEVAAQGGGAAARRLETQAAALAAAHAGAVPGAGRAAWSSLQTQLRTVESRLNRQLGRSGRRHGPELRPADEWLLDNAHVAEVALRQTRRDLPPGFVRELPRLRGARRVQALAQALLEALDGSFEPFSAARFVIAYQRGQPLTLGEVWALPAFLRLETLERLITVAGGPDAAGRDEGVAQAVRTLRALAAQDWRSFAEQISVVEAELRRDPAGVYPRMDFATRDRYRRAVERLARACGRPEAEVARAAVALAAAGVLGPADAPHHVGHVLMAGGQAALERALGDRPGRWTRLRRAVGRARLGLYFAALGLLGAATLGGLLAAALHAGAAPWALAALLALALAPAVVNAATLLNWALTSLVPPRVLPKMDGSGPVPAGSETLVAVPCLLNDAGELDGLLQTLERHHLGNGDRRVRFALLTDFTDAPQQVMPGDAALLARAQAGIAALNERYGEAFFLFHRPRLHNPREGCWMGWERKRGKLMALNRLLLRGGDSAFTVPARRPPGLEGVRYVLTLDADTELPPGSVRALVATFDHPLNRPVWNAAGRLETGFTVLQPRLETHPVSARDSAYARALSGGRGLDLYSQAVSEAYQDLFGDGIFAGKGLYDLAAFDRSVRGQIPDDQVLSHDLLEGALGRVGWVSDTVLIESSPSHYLAFTRRLERWVRGDWQLLAWLGRRGAAIGGLGRWKIAHNLLRSLHPPGVLGLLALAWSGTIGPPLPWTLLALLALGAPLAASGVSGLLGSVRVRSSEQLLTALVEEGQRLALQLIFLPHQSWVVLGAVGRALKRTFVTGRRRLEWTPAARVSRALDRRAGSGWIWAEMWEGPALAGAVLAALAAGTLHPPLLLAVPLLLAWFGSPHLAWWLSRPSAPRRAELTPPQRAELRGLARRTWLFFERFVGPDDHWLPPDHFQEQPLGVSAHRTSPTNIGLLLTSTLSAHDLGYLGPLELTLRLRGTLDSLRRLEHHGGHLLNWYDTRTLAPLHPPYVSTVDSGNLLGCLVAVRQGLLELPAEPVWQAQRWTGLLDILALLHAALERAGGAAAEARAWCAQAAQDVRAAVPRPEVWSALLTDLCGDRLARLEGAALQLAEEAQPPPDEETLWEVGTWIDRLRHHVVNLREQRDRFVPWLGAGAAPGELRASAAWAAVQALPTLPRLQDLPELYVQALAALDVLEAGAAEAGGRAWCAGLRSGLQAAAGHTRAWLDEVSALAALAEAEIVGARWDFLFDPLRQVFRLGYRTDLERPDDNAYDLLASESRLASFLAIALRQIGPAHWLHLARPMTRVGGRRVLLSWSGTAFEYLMPGLLMKTPPHTLLGVACASAVDTQRAHGRHHGVPWGVSESGYYHFDAALNYQYRAFGVPGLGLQRGLGDDLVVAPYASLLALPWRPAATLRNLARLRAGGVSGRYGCYEAADYTPARLPVGVRVGLVRSYMAHHQGMTLVSLGNVLGPRSMVDRFHADPRVSGAELLLYEQVPYSVPLERLQLDERRAPPGEVPGLSLAPWSAPPGPVPQLHLLSNGRYSVLISESGGGCSRWNDLELSRFRADPALQDWGSWLYLQDLDSGACWSPAPLPRPVGSAEEEDTVFSGHAARFHRRAHGVTSLLEVTVDPDQDAEVRRLTLRNEAQTTRRLRITGEVEAALSVPGADRAHPAFNKLFVQSEWCSDERTLLLRRRLRSAGEPPVWWGHLLARRGGPLQALSWTASRLAFLGRHGTPRTPAALAPDAGPLPGTVGQALDPVAALQTEVTLRAGEEVTLAWVAVAAATRAEALALARRFAAWPRIDEAFVAGRAAVARALRAAGIGTPELELGARLLAALTYPRPEWRADAAELRANTLGQRDLWGLGLSGDQPTVLLEQHAAPELEVLSQLLRLHRYWRERGIQIDLAVLNVGDQGYAQDVALAVGRLVADSGAEPWLGRRGGVFVLRAAALDEAGRRLLRASAVVLLSSAAGSLDRQLRPAPEPHDLPPLLPERTSGQTAAVGARETPDALAFWNGLGGFGAGGDEYVLDLGPGHGTPRPWVNVIASPGAGFVVSESGGGFSWAGNSGENRLTVWSNDPVGDRPGEALYLRDEETAEVWSPTPQPAPAPAPYRVRHGWGYTVFTHRSHGLRQTLRLYAAPDAPVKVIALHLHNDEPRGRRLTATYFAEWVLGAQRDVQAPHLIPDYDSARGALLARNPWAADVPAQVAFLASTHAPHGVTADRVEFLGRRGDLSWPAALRRVGLRGNVDPGGDPCAALQVHVDLPPGGGQDLAFVLGAGADAAEAERLLDTYRDPRRLEAVWEAAHASWRTVLGAVTVQTPDPALDTLLNGWLLYQTLSCRVWGRSALYQSSGAYGFRDQLQDVLALLHAAPELARAQILLAAAHQFTQGDVLHWWHPPHARGVRTRISDDLLWLPYVACGYVEATGDAAILDEPVTFLNAEELGPQEHERYDTFGPGPAAPLYEHLLRAVRRAGTAGPHGLPLMGGGDWNDGMNLVGAGGRGESVWLGWFLQTVLIRMIPLCRARGDAASAATFQAQAGQLRASLEAHAWDGGWYLRAFYDDGTPLGSARNRECRIDALSQAWAVLSGAADPARARMAMAAVDRYLVREDDGLILLLTPPFDRSRHHPGYIQGYPPGIRENGGQYSHAAVWTAWAFAALGDAGRAHRLFGLLNPVSHTRTPQAVGRFQTEPYVMPADVSSNPQHVGMGGWSWYTGSAAWMYRLGLEGLLGITREGPALRVRPCIPENWPEYRVTYRYGRSAYALHVTNARAGHSPRRRLDGRPLVGECVPLVDDGQLHRVEIQL